MEDIGEAYSIGAFLGSMDSIKEVRIRGTLMSKHNTFLGSNKEINKNKLSSIFRLVDGPLRYKKIKDTLIIIGEEDETENQNRTLTSPKKLNGKSKNYKGLFEHVIRETEDEGKRPKFEYFELGPKKEVYDSLASPTSLNLSRENIKKELTISNFNTGDSLEECIKEISKNKNLYNASIDKSILAIALTKEYISQIKNIPKKKEEAKILCDSMEYIIAASILQDYAIKEDKGAENTRGREHGRDGLRKLEGKILAHVRAGIVHHENHIEERQKKWSSLPTHTRIIALANDVYNKAKEGQFKSKIDRHGNYRVIDKRALMKSLPFVDPGRGVDNLTFTLYQFETALAKVGESKNIKKAAYKLINEKIIDKINSKELKEKTRNGFNSYVLNRPNIMY